MNRAAQTAHPYRPVPHKQARWLRYGVLLAAVLFIIGIFAPMMTISQFVVVRSSFSVFSGIVELLRNGQVLLFLLITGFSVVVPLLKLWVLFKLTARRQLPAPRLERLLRLMHDYGRWAMLDVMVVAILIVTVKLGTIASLQIHYGLYIFGSAVLLMMLLTDRVIRLTEATGRDR